MQPRISALLTVLVLASLASAPATAGGKKYFLTVDSFAGNEALLACGKGYHMAALWEIHEPTLLKYDAKRGETRADSGSGPAAELGGWVRTGGAASAANNPGVANCSAWTSGLMGDYGTAVELDGGWDGPAEIASPWNAFTATCDSTLPVWCKQN
jgi:hypothetical protein